MLWRQRYSGLLHTSITRADPSWQQGKWLSVSVTHHNPRVFIHSFRQPQELNGVRLQLIWRRKHFLTECSLLCVRLHDRFDRVVISFNLDYFSVYRHLYHIPVAKLIWRRKHFLTASSVVYVRLHGRFDRTVISFCLNYFSVYRHLCHLPGVDIEFIRLRYVTCQDKPAFRWLGTPTFLRILLLVSHHRARQLFPLLPSAASPCIVSGFERCLRMIMHANVKLSTE